MHACGHDMHVTWLAGATALLAALARRLERDACWPSSSPPRRPPQGAQAHDRRRPVRPLPEAATSSSASTSCPARRATSPTAPGRRRPPPTASRSGSSAAARTARCPSPASTPSSWPPPPCCACRRSSRARSPPRSPPSSRSARCRPGTKDNVIPDDALLKLNVRTFDEDVRAHVLDAIERIVNAEAAASGAPQPPQITTTEHYPLLSNDPRATARVAAALRDHFGDERVARARAARTRPARTSARSAPSGACRRCSGTSAAPTPTSTARAEQAGRVAEDIPTNHNPTLRPRHPPDARDRRRGDDHRRARRAGQLSAAATSARRSSGSTRSAASARTLVALRSATDPGGGAGAPALLPAVGTDVVAIAARAEEAACPPRFAISDSPTSRTRSRAPWASYDELPVPAPSEAGHPRARQLEADCVA